MNVRNWFSSVEAVIPEVSPTKTLGESMIAREVLVGQLEFCRLDWPVIHVICSVNLWSHFHPVFGIFERFRILYRKFSSLHELLVFAGQVDALSLQSLLKDLALDQTFGLSEFIDRLANFSVSGHFGSLNVHFLSPGAILDPRRTVFAVGRLVQSSFPNSRKSTVLSIIHKNGKWSLNVRIPFIDLISPKLNISFNLSNFIRYVKVKFIFWNNIQTLRNM